MGFRIEDGVLKEYTEEPGVTEVIIPDSVTTIGKYAFYRCKSLRSVFIPDSVTAIGVYAFSSCENLTNIVIPSSVTIIWGGAFSDCTSLTRIVIPDSVIPIGEYAFSGCSSLTSISIPDSVVSICNHAFYGCSNLTSISIPSSAISIGESAFDGCGKLTTILAKAKLSQKAFGKTKFYAPIVTIDPAMLPLGMRHLATVGYAENPEEFEPGRKKSHLKYLKANAEKMVDEALTHPALLHLILENKLLTRKTADLFLDAAIKQQLTETTALLLDYKNQNAAVLDPMAEFNL